jgi:hypothetical protein
MVSEWILGKWHTLGVPASKTEVLWQKNSMWKTYGSTSGTVSTYAKGVLL